MTLTSCECLMTFHFLQQSFKPMAFKIRNIELQDGSSFSPSPITVIVGANNCGKTRFLKEIDQYLQGNSDFDYKILKSISSEKSDFDEIIGSLGIGTSSPPDNSSPSFRLREGYFGYINFSSNKDYVETLRKDISQKGPMESKQFREAFGKACVAMVQTEDRLIASKSAPVNPNETGFLDTIYNGGTPLEQRVSGYTFQVFGLHIKLDFTVPGRLSIKVGADFSDLPQDPRDARSILEQNPLLEEQGDGFRSFTTTLLMFLTTKRPFILVDEPDAFLHPPQAAALGRIIAEIASAPQSIILATHSADLLRGIMSARSDVHVLRLTRGPGGTSGNILDSKEIQTILQTPLLNSTRVLDSLFYQGVVIMEGDSDRTFYEKIARQYFPGDEIHYIHAHNKQTIHKLIGPYAKAAVRFAVILDFDVLRDRHDLRKIIEATTHTEHLETVWELQKLIQDSINTKAATDLYKDLLRTLDDRVSKESQLVSIDSLKGDKDRESERRIADFKSDIKKAIEDTDKWSLAKQLGSSGLPQDVRFAFDALDSICRSIGVYIVPCGSLESWLTEFGVLSTKNNKTKWITKALVWLDEKYPIETPVRDFIHGIHDKLKNH